MTQIFDVHLLAHFLKIFMLSYAFECMGVCACECKCPWRSEASDPLELETPVICEPPTGAAGDQTQELSTTEACALNYCAVSPAPQVTFDILTCISMHMMNTHTHTCYI